MGGGAGLLKELGSIAGSAAFSGTSPRFFKRVLQTALVWTLYEHLLNPARKLYEQQAGGGAAGGEPPPAPRK